VTCFQELDRFVTQAGAKLESTLKFDDLVDAPPSENNDGRAQVVNNNNLEHASATIVADSAPTDADIPRNFRKWSRVDSTTNGTSKLWWKQQTPKL
jgi:hypothetical protein